jgi:hypothetical protein
MGWERGQRLRTALGLGVHDGGRWGEEWRMGRVT